MWQAAEVVLQMMMHNNVSGLSPPVPRACMFARGLMRPGTCVSEDTDAVCVCAFVRVCVCKCMAHDAGPGTAVDCREPAALILVLNRTAKTSADSAASPSNAGNAGNSKTGQCISRLAQQIEKLPRYRHNKNFLLLRLDASARR